MNDKVVYLAGRTQQSNNQEDQLIAQANKAIREAILQVARAYRTGDVRGIAIITIENDNSSTWRVAGNCSDFEIVAALEFTKTNLITEA